MSYQGPIAIHWGLSNIQDIEKPSQYPVTDEATWRQETLGLQKNRKVIRATALVVTEDHGSHPDNISILVCEFFNKNFWGQHNSANLFICNPVWYDITYSTSMITMKLFKD